MKTSNKILIIAYAVIIIALTTVVFASRPLVERAILGPGSLSNLMLQD